MSQRDLYLDLKWLARPPEDFRQRCRDLLECATDVGRELIFLSGHALNENQLLRLANVIAELQLQRRALSPLTPFRLGILGNGTLEPIASALVASAPRHGIALECIRADFAQTLQEALSPEGIINRAKPDAVLLALDYRGLPLLPGSHSPESATANVSEAIVYLQALRDGFRDHSAAPSIVQTLAPPPETIFGSFDRVADGMMQRLTADFNTALVQSLNGTQDVLLDVCAIAATVGLSQWHSATQWNLAKLSFAAEAIPLYADHVCRLLGALRGKSRKCLILDLDNTVWGGIIGDDGLEGIVLGQGDATGEAYLDVQRLALSLRDRGIVLAVSSKNTDSIAREVFQKHPEMLLREDHIAVFQANWNDKATNISAIAKELSLGIDSIVFLDDNPVERGLVRRLLPQVAVPELPEDPALYARTLAAAGYFDSVTFSEEDRNRAAYYQGNALRVALQAQTGDLDAYLASLNMTISFSPFDATGRSRIAQLINKSNQFNLTTRRYSDIDVARFETDPSYFTLQVRLRDIFGDNGMISVIICRESQGDWEIDTWLMSCRVLGRGVERMVLREILHHARSRGARRLIGTYIPTEKNAMVQEHYRKLGFTPLDITEAGVSKWEMATDTIVDAAAMQVEYSGFDLASSSR